MKYTEEQRLDIAKHVYDRDLTVEEAASPIFLITLCKFYIPFCRSDENSRGARLPMHCGAWILTPLDALQAPFSHHSL